MRKGSEAVKRTAAAPQAIALPAEILQNAVRRGGRPRLRIGSAGTTVFRTLLTNRLPKCTPYYG
jgi:hypothetical protein